MLIFNFHLSELQKCALFLWSPWSKMQNCGEFRLLHPGSWAEASKSWFWSLALKPHVSLTFSLANWPVWAPGAPWGFWASKSWFWSLAPKPHVSLTFSLANWSFLAAGAPWGFWASKSWFWSLAPKPHVWVGRTRGCWSGWWLGPLAVGRVGGWVPWFEVGGFTFLVL